MNELEEVDAFAAVVEPVPVLDEPVDELEELEDEPTVSPTAAVTVAIVPATGAVSVVLSSAVCALSTLCCAVVTAAVACAISPSVADVDELDVFDDEADDEVELCAAEMVCWSRNVPVDCAICAVNRAV